MRTFWGAVLGLLLFFPGTVLLQSVTRGLGLYQTMSLTESCLVMIMILLAVLAVQRRPRSEQEAKAQARPELRRAAGSRTRSYDDDRARSDRRRSRF
ncbi:MAG TPA: hypothetical protein VGM19_03255 [Armatimonadota bacterium]|jgi:ABC-type branched-subunit amino acid transport system permease subunit